MAAPVGAFSFEGDEPDSIGPDFAYDDDAVRLGKKPTRTGRNQGTDGSVSSSRRLSENSDKYDLVC
jgi:hypothetical protein